MTTDLMNWVEERMSADSTLDDSVGLLVLAALEGTDALEDYLQNGPTKSDAQVRSSARAVVGPATGAFLRSVQVTGFRGIGTRVTLALEPLPGLTVVAGRNGSGKSSIAEGLEMALTGGTYRWKNKRSTQWSDCWRNVHHPGETAVVAEFVEEGTGPVRLSTRWDPGTEDVGSHATTAQRTVNGTRGPAQDFETLGWGSALETYRPMLSYDELGGLLEAGPSELYDAIAKVLGTEQLADALTRIKSHLAQLSSPQKAAVAERRSLQAEAAVLLDERAAAVAVLLKKTTPDTVSIREVSTGVKLPDHGVVASLRALTQLSSPDPAAVAAHAQRLRAAVASMAQAGEAEAARASARLDLRRRALVLHAEHGEQTCPVCSKGLLDDVWASSSRELVARREAELKELSDARAELDAARRSLRSDLTPRPPVTDRSPTEELVPAMAEVRTNWDSFEAVPEGDLALADHLERYAVTLAASTGATRAEAAAALATRDDAWSPLAVRISGWCSRWDETRASKPLVDDLTAAEQWLKENDTRLKNERIAPISEKAKFAWSLLRQESNVDLGDLRLEGQANRRRVALTASIDGMDVGSALPVMSQGELHALALALFLPRATLDESPFRFVVLDDPVQAMDPAKVDGLVALLSEIAKTRQVIVFSHDDRLPAALRRLNTSARVYEVVRGPDSAVTISPADDPSTRYLSDADALCKDTKVPDETLRRILPGLLRMAIETEARDRFYARRLSRGDRLSDVEATWSDARTTGHRVSLAIHDEVKPLDGWLRTESRQKSIGVASGGFHKGLYSSLNPRDAVHHARRTVDDIRTGGK